MNNIFFIAKNAQRSTTPNIQKATFKNAEACKPRARTYPLQHCTPATLHAPRAEPVLPMGQARPAHEVPSQQGSRQQHWWIQRGSFSPVPLATPSM